MAAAFELAHLVGVAVLAGEGGGSGRDLEAMVLEGCLTWTHLVTVEAGDPGSRVRAHFELRDHSAGLVPVAVRALAARPDLFRRAVGDSGARPVEQHRGRHQHPGNPDNHHHIPKADAGERHGTAIAYSPAC